MTPTAARDREAARQIAVALQGAEPAHHVYEPWVDLIADALTAIRADERERCAKIARRVGYGHAGTMKRSHTRRQIHRVTNAIAAAIRASATEPSDA